jgi:hypothetical protein
MYDSRYSFKKSPIVLGIGQNLLGGVGLVKTGYGHGDFSISLLLETSHLAIISIALNRVINFFLEKICYTSNNMESLYRPYLQYKYNFYILKAIHKSHIAAFDLKQNKLTIGCTWTKNITLKSDFFTCMCTSIKYKCTCNSIQGHTNIPFF